MFGLNLSQMFKPRTVVEAEAERDATILEEEIQTSAKNIEMIMEERIERIEKIMANDKYKTIFAEMQKNRRGRRV